MRSVDHSLRDEMVDALLVLHLGDEDHLCVAAAHLLQRLEVADLHGCLRVQLLRCHSHQFGGFDVCLS